MPQISLYIDGDTLKKVESAASHQHVSISKWVVKQIRAKVDPMYPKGFEDIFGSITDKTFLEPQELSRRGDSPREKF
jgi:hypothetical protein